MTCPRSHSSNVAKLTPNSVACPSPHFRTPALLKICLPFWGPSLLDLPWLPPAPSSGPLPPCLPSSQLCLTLGGWAGCYPGSRDNRALFPAATSDCFLPASHLGRALPEGIPVDKEARLPPVHPLV